MGVMTFFSDKLSNVAAALGGSRDKWSSTSFSFGQMTTTELWDAYRGDWMVRQAVDVPALDMCREWRDWQADKDQIEAIEELERDLDIRAKVLKGLKLARLYGGAALLLGIGTDEPEEELNFDSVGKGDLRYVHVMTKQELTAGAKRRDPEDPWYGEPDYYQLSMAEGGVYQVHPSRVIRLNGNERLSMSDDADVWGDSIVYSIADAVKNAGTATQAIAALLLEAKIDVIKVPGLMEALGSEEYTNRLTTRFSTAMSLKSLVNTLILDAEEEYEQKQINFSTFPELIREYTQLVAGAADIPVTRLLGQSPGGMNATGESDLKNYYDRIKAEQNIGLRGSLAPLDEVLIRSATGARDDAIHYTWAPLFQLDEKTQVEIEKTRAETVSSLINTGLVPSGVLAKATENALIESGRWPGIEGAFEEYGEEAEAFDPEAGNPNNPDEIEPEA